MEIEWDEEKDAQNRAKHGLALADAAQLDWAVGRDIQDGRADYGEIRFVRYAMLDLRLHVCVYTMRGDSRRIISLRKANNREILNYGI